MVSKSPQKMLSEFQSFLRHNTSFVLTYRQLLQLRFLNEQRIQVLLYHGMYQQ